MADRVAAGLGVTALLSAAPAPTEAAPEDVLTAFDWAKAPVDVDRATPVENNTTTVMSEPAATATRAIAIVRDGLRVGEADIGLQLFHQANRSSPTPLMLLARS